MDLNLDPGTPAGTLTALEKITLGRAGFQVTRMGLGGGGHSRLGQRTNRSQDESVALVRRALELGVNFIDTAESYGTEPIIGQAIRGRDRSKIFLSTKKSIPDDQHLTRAELRAGLEGSLARLGTDYVDVYHLHGLLPDQYQPSLENLVPEMLKLKDEGKIRAVGITEAFNSDRGHAMLQRAVQDNCWDVMMVGFSILNQSARDRVLQVARQKEIGVLCMFAVRVGLSRPEKLREIVRTLIDKGEIDPQFIDANDPLGFVTSEGAATSITDAAYRFARDEPGVHAVLSGTGDTAHLEQNSASLQRPPLPQAITQRLKSMFVGVESVSGQ